MSQTNTKDDLNKTSDSNGLVTSSFTIQGTQVINQNINLLEIKEWILQILPRMEIQFTDPKIFFDVVPLQDNDLIEFNLASTKESKDLVNIKFRLVDYETDIVNTNFSDIRLTGILDTKQLFSPIYNRSLKGTSSDIIKQIASEMGLTPVIRVESNDKMVWYQINLSNYDMINHIMNRAYVSDDDSVFIYVNRKSELIYTSLRTELKKEKVVDLKYDTNRKPPEVPSDGTKSKDNKPKDDKEDNVLYYDSIKYFNRSGHLNRLISYGKEYSYFKDGKSVTESVVDDSHPFTDFSYKDKDNIGLTVQHQYFGLLSGNMHENYYKSLIQNQYFKTNFFGSPLLLTIDVTDKLNLFDIVNVSVMKSRDGEMNETYSGKYLVGGIHYYINNTSPASMVLVLFRNGLNKNSFIEDDHWHLNEFN